MSMFGITKSQQRSSGVARKSLRAENPVLKVNEVSINVKGELSINGKSNILFWMSTTSYKLVNDINLPEASMDLRRARMMLSTTKTPCCY